MKDRFRVANLLALLADSFKGACPKTVKAALLAASLGGPSYCCSKGLFRTRMRPLEN